MNVHEVIRRPLVTEKSNIVRDEQNVYTLDVDPRATKLEIARAVEALFENTSVLEVRTMRYPGKLKRQGKFVGRKPAWKKALVRLAEGQTIEFFEGV